MAHKILGGIPEDQLVFGVVARTLSAYLTQYDTLFLVGDCGDSTDAEWQAIKDMTNRLVSNVMDFDVDGPSLQFMNNPKSLHNCNVIDRFGDTMDSIRRMGVSKVGIRLEEILNEYISRAKRVLHTGGSAAEDLKPLSIVVVSDGDFDEDTTQILNDIKPLLEAARDLPPKAGIDRWVGIQFLQIGNESATAARDSKLANTLPSDVNFIDTFQFASDQVPKELPTDDLYRILLGAINAQVAQFVHTNDPHWDPLDDPERPFPGELKHYQVGLWIPEGKTATISGQSNWNYDGVGQTFTIYQVGADNRSSDRVYLAYFVAFNKAKDMETRDLFGYKSKFKKGLTSVSVEGGTFIQMDFTYYVYLYFHHLHAKMVSKERPTLYTFGTHVDGRPGDEYTDSIITVRIS